MKKILPALLFLLLRFAIGEGEEGEEGGTLGNLETTLKENNFHTPCPLSLRIHNSSANAVNFGWTFPCHDLGTSYKIHYTHLEWIACPYGTRSQDESAGRGYVKTMDTDFTISGLIPYSRYRITVKAIPGNKDLPVVEKFIVAETLSLPPEVQFGESAIPTKASENSLKFFWRDPRTSDCKNFHGDITHGRYIFKGEDSWNFHDEREGLISIDENSKEFGELHPYSLYSFSLYTLNSAKMLNPKPLVFKSRTLPSTPPSPMHLEVLTSSSKDSVPLRWQPGYPPTGKIQRFVVKWKYSEAENWLSSLSIPASMAKDMCDENEFQYNCYSITELNTKRNLTFVITAYNEGVSEKSEWSSEARFTTNHTAVVVPLNKAGGTMALWKILLIVLFSLVALTLILGLFWIKCCQHKDRKYLSVPIYHMSKQSGKGLEEPSNLSSPLTRELSKSIQNVPLPPVPGEHLYEELPTNKSRSTKNLEYDEDMYLRPKNIPNAKSLDSLDVSEYLQPTFKVVTDTSNLSNVQDSVSDDKERTSPIPIRSYEQKPLNRP